MKTRNDMKENAAIACHFVRSAIVRLCIAGPWLYFTLAAVCETEVAAQTFAPTERFVGMLADGTRINADSIKEWHDDTARPVIAGRAIFDPKNPVRWLVDQSVPLAETPSAYLEMFGGDRLPCRVVDYQRSATWSYEATDEYLVVKPLVEVDFPGRLTTPFLRVSTEWLKKVVFETRAGIPSEWRPGTVFLHDGSRMSYRVVRWSAGGLSLLTDSGVKRLLYSQVAELHLPRQNSWDLYFEQLAALTPDLSARLIRAETLQGINITVSTERFSAKHSGDRSKSENWYPLLHPAWSLDPITLPFRTIRSLIFFSPEQPPMLMFEPTATRADPVFSTGWDWRLNRNVQSSVLRNNQLLAGWGFGVHAPTTLTLPLHHVVRQVRCRVGLDQVVGNGGCVRAAMALQSRVTQPFYQSDVLVGNKKSADSSWRNVTVAPGKSDSLQLVADPVNATRPKGADPFDVRDCLDWNEPEWKLDQELLSQEVTARASTRLTVADGWAVSSQLPVQNTVSNSATSSSTNDGSADNGLLIKNAWDRLIAEDERTRLLIKPSGPFVVFSQFRQIRQQDRWLAICMSKPAESTDAASVIVRINGRVMLESAVPAKTSRLDPDPVLVPVALFQGDRAFIQIILISHGEKSFVDWRGNVLCEHPPGIAPLFDESGDLIEQLRDGEGQLSLTTSDTQHGQYSLKLTSGDRSSASVTDFDFPIREYPESGEYRYLRFGWKKTGGTRIGLQLAHDGSLGVPENEFGRQQPRAFPPSASRRHHGKSPRKPVSGANRGSQFGYQYDAGTSDPVAPVMRLDRKLPEKWTLIQRDLFGEFGSFNVTGLGFQCSDDEPAFFDQIYLARQQSDFNWIDEVSGVAATQPSDDPNLIAEARRPFRFGELVSRVAPQFATSESGEPIQLLGEYQGRKNVLRTMPPTKDKACVLKAPVSPAKGKKTVLKLSAGRYPEGDWQLIVRVNGQELLQTMIDSSTAKDGWFDRDIDLSRFAGQNVIVEVFNKATGWNYEHAFWSQLKIVEQ